MLATGPNQTMKQYLEYWLEDVHKAKVRLGTYEVYRSIVYKHLIPGLGYSWLEKLTERQVQSFYAKKHKEGLSATRVRSIHRVLHKALEHARRIKLVGSTICDDVELPRVEQHEVQSLTPEQAQLLLQKVREHRLEARLKAGAAWIDRDLVFCNRHGDFLLPMTLFTQFSRLLKKVGLPHMRFHDLRHSAATLLLSMDVPMKVVQELLGHSRFSLTADTYSHVLPSMQQEAMSKMDDFLRRQS